MDAYIDKYVLISPKITADHIFDELASILLHLELPSNQEKQTPPCRTLTCLGIRIDLDANIRSFDTGNVNSIHLECLAVRHRRHLTKRTFQPLLGKSLYLYKQESPACMFTNRMLALFREKSDAYISLQSFTKI